jgi:hypothetical protein
MWRRKKKKKRKNNPKYSGHFVLLKRQRAAHALHSEQNSGHFVPLQRLRAAHALREDQIITKIGDILFHCNAKGQCTHSTWTKVLFLNTFIGPFIYYTICFFPKYNIPLFPSRGFPPCPILLERVFCVL